ncbi:MAG: helix-turn-helix domain-containing protein [Candidatus Omnitrophica bacterium]|jgi:ribosome-binding protein aMBF1 (putative translation factor)|nr:helix-turn-helix domain-containing protein [Candidatus Omnitrophota bacterium]
MQENVDRQYKVARNIMNARRARVMTIENLAEKTEIDIEFLKSIERIDPPLIPDDILKKIAKTLGVTLSDLLK